MKKLITVSLAVITVICCQSITWAADKPNSSVEKLIINQTKTTLSESELASLKTTRRIAVEAIPECLPALNDKAFRIELYLYDDLTKAANDFRKKGNIGNPNYDKLVKQINDEKYSIIFGYIDGKTSVFAICMSKKLFSTELWPLCWPSLAHELVHVKQSYDLMNMMIKGKVDPIDPIQNEIDAYTRSSEALRKYFITNADTWKDIFKDGYPTFQKRLEIILSIQDDSAKKWQMLKDQDQKTKDPKTAIDESLGAINSDKTKENEKTQPDTTPLLGD